MEHLSGHTETLNLSSTEGTAQTLSPNLTGTDEERDLRAAQFSRLLESEYPADSAEDAEVEESSTRLTEQVATLTKSPRGSVDPEQPQLQTGVTTATRSEPAAVPDKAVPTAPIAELSRPVMDAVHSDTADTDSAGIGINPDLLHTPKLSVLSEEGGTPAEPVANLTAVAAVTQEFEDTADKSRVVPATSTQTPAQAVKNDLTASPMSVLRADAAIPDRVTTLPLDTSVRLSGTESSRLAPPVDAEPVNPVMPEITENRKAQVVTGLAGELLKDSPGVAHSRLGSPVGQLKVTTTSETPYDEQVLAGLPIKSASDSTALPVHTAPLASSVTPFSNVQQLEAVGRLRTLLNQTVPVQDETPALQANTARVTSVAVEGGKTQIPADAAQLVTSTVSPNPEVHSRSGEQSVSPQVNVNPLGQAMPEKLMSETVGALVTPVAADLKALPVSAGEFMVAQAVSTNGLQPTATTAVTGATAMATPVAIQDPEMPVRLGGQLRLMVEGGVQSASLQVKPAELGPIQISLLSDNDRLTVNIMAGNAVTRDLLDSALPRLREQLGQGQFNQIDVNISDSGKGQQQSGAGFGNDASFYQAEQEVAQRENSDSQASSDEAPDDESAPDNSEKTVARNPVSSDGRIDAYI